jgi:protoporphyrinogen oxidase
VVRPRKSRILHDGLFFDYPLRLSGRTLATLGLIRTGRFALTYAYRRLRPVQPETSLADFYRNRFGDALYHTFFKSYTEKVWGVPCEALSAEWGAQRVKGVSVVEALRQALIPRRGKATEASLIEQFLYPYYGPGQLWNRVAEEIQALGGQIEYRARVVQLSPHEVRFEDSRGQTHTLPCAAVFSSIPLNELGALLGNRLSDTARDIATRLAYRHFLIVGLAVPILRYRGYPTPLTDTWIYLQDSRVQAGRLQLFHNWSAGMVPEPGQPWVGLEYFCSESDALWQASDAELAGLAAAELEVLGLARATEVSLTAVVRAPKAYPVYAGGWQNFDRLKAELLNLPDLYCIGRNGMHRYNNQDHSMLTAFAAAEHYLQPTASDPAAIWDINTEDDYHETKA